MNIDRTFSRNGRALIDSAFAQSAHTAVSLDRPQLIVFGSPVNGFRINQASQLIFQLASDGLEGRLAAKVVKLLRIGFQVEKFGRKADIKINLKRPLRNMNAPLSEPCP